MPTYKGYAIPIPDMIVHKCAGISQDPLMIPEHIMGQILSPGKIAVGGTSDVGSSSVRTPARYSAAANTSRSGQMPLATGFHGLQMARPPSRQMPFGGGGMTAAQMMQQGQPTAMVPQPGQLPTAPSAQLEVPPTQAYQPYAGGSQVQQNINQMAEYGQGLMDPGSDYYKRLSAAMQGQIGAQTAAQQRAAALRGAWGGLGAGASPEMLATTGQLGQAGLEAMGAAEAGLALQAPQIGAGMMQATFGPGVNLQQLGEQSRQYGAGMAEQARQFGAGLGLQQQQLASEQAWRQAQLQQQAQQQQMDALMRYYSMMFGMF